MRKRSPHQLSLFDEPEAGNGESEPAQLVTMPEPEIVAQPDTSNDDTIRSWLLQWGEAHQYPGFSFPFARGSQTDRRYGRMHQGKDGWKLALHPPYNQREVYPGEWLHKCLEQVQRFDSKQSSIPEQIYGRSGDDE